MKTALLQYWLTKSGGAEKVLGALGEMYPDADLFTHAYLPAKAPGFEHFNVSESFISRLPLGRKHPQAYLPLLPLASRTFDLSAYDLIISSEAGPIKGVRKRPDQRHVCYCHSPMRYIWDMYDEYYRNAGFGGKLAMRMFTPYMRHADLKSAESVDVFVANSHILPVGTIGYRFDYHWKRGVQPSRTGPEVREIWLGKRRVTWDEMKSDYEVYEPLSVPCYWFRPQWFFNLDGRDFAKWLLGYFLVVNVLLTSVWFGISRGKNV